MTPQEIDEPVLVTERNRAALVRVVRQLQRENAELREGIRNWSYCMDVGMRKECPEKVEELADFLCGLGIAPYSLPRR